MFRVQGVGLRVQGAGCRVQGAGLRVQGLPAARYKSEATRRVQTPRTVWHLRRLFWRAVEGRTLTCPRCSILG